MEELVAVWREKGIVLNPGASNEELDHFERTEKLKLPPDFRQLYHLTNGMPENECDHCMLSLWSLDRIQRERVDLAGSSEDDWPYVVFADGMIDACFFALRGRSAGIVDVVVIWDFCPIVEELLADSVRGLATRYLTQGLPGLFNE